MSEFLPICFGLFLTHHISSQVSSIFAPGLEKYLNVICRNKQQLGKYFYCPKELVFTFAGHIELRVLELEIS